MVDYDPRVPRRAGWMFAAAGVYALGLAIVGLWPSHVNENVDVMSWEPTRWVLDRLRLTIRQGYDVIEFGTNVVWFAPFGLFLRALRPAWSWTVVLIAGLRSRPPLRSSRRLRDRAARPRSTTSSPTLSALRSDVSWVRPSTTCPAAGGLVARQGPDSC